MKETKKRIEVIGFSDTVFPEGVLVTIVANIHLFQSLLKYISIPDVTDSTSNFLVKSNDTGMVYGVEKDSVRVGFLHNDGKIYLVKMPMESVISSVKYKPGQYVMMNDLVEKYPLLINVDNYFDEYVNATIKQGHIGMIINVSRYSSVAFNFPVDGEIKSIIAGMPTSFLYAGSQNKLTSEYLKQLWKDTHNNLDLIPEKLEHLKEKKLVE